MFFYLATFIFLLPFWNPRIIDVLALIVRFLSKTSFIRNSYNLILVKEVTSYLKSSLLPSPNTNASCRFVSIKTCGLRKTNLHSPPYLNKCHYCICYKKLLLKYWITPCLTLTFGIACDGGRYIDKLVPRLDDSEHDTWTNSWWN